MDVLLNKFWRLNIICCAGIALTTLYEKGDITSLLFYLSFLITAFCMWLCLRKPVTRYSGNTLLILLYLVLMGFISVMQGGVSFAYLKKFIIYITTLSSFYIASKIHANSRTVAYLLGSNIVVSVFYMIRSQAEGAYIGDVLLLFFSNPNFTGMWLFMSIMLLVVTLFLVKKKFWKCIIAALAGYLVYLCFETEARNIWFAIGYAAFLCVLCLAARVPRFKKWVLFAIDLYPLLFAVAYMFAIANNMITEDVSDLLVSEGKPITSRYAIWKTAFDAIKERPLFGAYSTIGGGSGSFQLHNTHIDMWAAYGTVGLSFFLWYIYRIMKEVNDFCNSKGAMFALAGFMCMTLMGCAEAGLYSTGMGMYIYVSSFLLLANYLNRKQQNESCISI